MTDLKPIFAISWIASGLVAPPQAIVVSTCAKVEMPGISFFVTCCAETAVAMKTPTKRMAIFMRGIIRLSAWSSAAQLCVRAADLCARDQWVRA